MTNDRPNVLPITFGIPTCKLAKPNKNKIQEYATCIPGHSETYIFENEQDYYQDYQQSYYGITMKKAGWDSLRHYEILGNYCIPYFIGLENCPEKTLANLPKDLLLEARELVWDFDETRYFNILDELFEHTCNTLTTKHLAQYILDRLP